MADESRIQNVKAPYLTIEEQASGSVGNPDAGTQRIFVDSTSHEPKIKDSAGSVSSLGGGGDSITNSNISPTTADVTLAVNTRYFIDASGLTANRNAKLPAGEVGDIIELNIKTGDDTYALIVIGDTGITINGGSAATEWSRLFISKEFVRLVADTTSNWQVIEDGRIPCIGQMTLSAAETTNTAGAATTPTWDNKVIDVGQICDTVNYRMNVRRAGYYRISGSYYANSTVTDQNYIDVSVYVNAVVVVETYLYGSATTNHLISLSPKTVLCAVNDQIIYKYSTQQANKGMGAAADKSWFQVEEVLSGNGGGPSTQLEMDYVEFTSNVSPTATTEGTANTVVTANAVVFSGSTPVLVEFYAVNARPDTGAAGRDLSFWLYQDGSSIGRVGYISVPDVSGANGMSVPVHVFRRLTPSAGSHTYSIRASVSAGTGLVGAGAGGAGNSFPGYIRISKAN